MVSIVSLVSLKRGAVDPSRFLPLRAVALTLLGCLALTGLGGCVTASRGDNAYPPLDVEDPDPEKDKDSPKFCNPSGKAGDDLTKCQDFNESVYKEFDEEAKKREPWFNFTPDSWAASPEVDEKLVLPVTNDKEAVVRLESAPAVELTPADVALLTGKTAEFPGLKPFLVRALIYYRDTGTYAVFQKGDAILVRHDSIGKEDVNETRSAVVVFLAAAPKAVYVDCAVAE